MKRWSEMVRWLVRRRQNKLMTMMTSIMKWMLVSDTIDAMITVSDLFKLSTAYCVEQVHSSWLRERTPAFTRPRDDWTVFHYNRSLHTSLANKKKKKTENAQREKEHRTEEWSNEREGKLLFSYKSILFYDIFFSSSFSSNHQLRWIANSR